ncbi:MAG TPA: glycosyltransferase family 2 protein [Crocinitomix sp.]|nr:glycosyltransferase family 2 protein [Crocinitomix sp.]
MALKNRKPNIAVIIPAHNEEKSIVKVIKEIPKQWVETIIVCSNNSTDNTVLEAKKAGAIVLEESKKGYGWACAKGINYANNMSTKPEIIVFMDGDYSDYPQELPKVVAPIIKQNIDLVIGSRARGQKEVGSMTFPQRFGNQLSTKLMKLFYGVTYTDLGPFRAIKLDKLLALNMQEMTYGWTIEMQIKAAKQKMTYAEVPVNYKVRIGESKVSGTLKGAIMAGIKILWCIAKYKFKR